ncbi:MAG: hypothetical protein HKN43_02085 [Rhodothermales bacterium]|nr:hypothetical protein [Rhodothermales bacterium]
MEISNQPARIAVNCDQFIKRLILTCVAIQAAMVVGDYIFNYSYIVDQPSIDPLFNITREDGLASFFAVLQSALISVTLWAIVIVVRRKNFARATVIGWTIVASFFSYMTLDDGSKLHERIGSLVYDLTHAGGDAASSAISSFPSYIWQIVFLPIFATLGLFILVFMLRELKTRKQKAFVIIALGLFASAVVLDFFEGLYDGHPLNIFTMITNTFDMAAFTAFHFGETPFDTLVHFSKSIEEAIEMFAMTLFWVVFLRYLFKLGTIEISFESEGAMSEMTNPQSNGHAGSIAPKKVEA